MTSKAQQKATIKYLKKAYQRYTIRVRKDDEKDIIDKLESVGSINKYVKDLIKADMKKK